MAGSCGHENEPSGSIKCGEFVDELSALLTSQGHCNMGLVLYICGFPRKTAPTVGGNVIYNCKCILTLEVHVF